MSATMAEGVALLEANSHLQRAVVEGSVLVYVLHRVNALRCMLMELKKKKKKLNYLSWKDMTPYLQSLTLSPKHA
jgi:succinate dehydrogenase/fumarate reductase cytochrome b subunit